MMEIVKRFTVSLLAVLVLCSTMSFTVHKHFCGPFLKDVSVIVPSDGCGMEMAGDATECSLDKKSNCCHDDTDVIKIQDDLKLSLKTFQFKAPVAITTTFLQYHVLITGDDYKQQPFTSYSPPLVIHDIPVLHQSFLI